MLDKYAVEIESIQPVVAIIRLPPECAVGSAQIDVGPQYRHYRPGANPQRHQAILLAKSLDQGRVLGAVVKHQNFAYGNGTHDIRLP